ncbi:hypothetical protein [Caldinitratiruptor microaerophilus]|uniref:Uncharacterized protein n=1 Tax=Caldinitratiruptor microaerophilus TaxID=671077 RepID=A0AA35CIM6_9FIRM|nr:hypothetical protein [Caldinitratiruptor microaerophilus]BDG59038.1 hypothetical protein caldi_01280 [Caldinitratiruptor microaerophilus]
MVAIGVAGTAKNTGKTTTLTALLQVAAGLGAPVGLTSIGFDGEDLDHLTGLPKPRVDVPAGTWVATARPLLKVGTARLEPVSGTGVQTAVGEVVLARAEEAGRVVLAGPATAAGLRTVLAALPRSGLCLVDGAFGRMAPMLATQGLVLATGAAYRRQLPALLAETAALVWLFERPVLDPPAGPVVRLHGILTPNDAKQASEALRRFGGAAGELRLVLGGVVPVAGLEILAEVLEALPIAPEIQFDNVMCLALGGPPLKVRGLLRRLGRRSRVGLARGFPLLAVTVNPFFPDESGGKFRPGYVDGQRLREEMAASLPVPVVDVRQQDASTVLHQVVGNLLSMRDLSIEGIKRTSSYLSVAPTHK